MIISVCEHCFFAFLVGVAVGWLIWFMCWLFSFKKNDAFPSCLPSLDPQDIPPPPKPSEQRSIHRSSTTKDEA